MDSKLVYALVLDAEKASAQYVAGVFSTLEKVQIAAMWLERKTHIYTVPFYFDDQLQIGDIIMIGLVEEQGMNVPQKAYVMNCTLYLPSEMSFTSYDPSRDYISAYVDTIAKENKHLIEYLKTGIMPLDDTPQINPTPKPQEDNDMCDEDRKFWHNLLSFL